VPGAALPVVAVGAADDPGAAPGLLGAPGAREPVAVPGATERCPKIAEAIFPKMLMALSRLYFLRIAITALR